MAGRGGERGGARTFGFICVAVARLGHEEVRVKLGLFFSLLRAAMTREVRPGCVAAAPSAECLVLWFCVSLLCDIYLNMM